MEAGHFGMHSAQQQIQQVRTTYYGHVSSYDPKKGAVKLLIPMLRDENDEPVETNWVQLGSMMVGDKWGIQWAPKAGATKDEPEKGEQCRVTVIERSNGLFSVENFSFHDNKYEPPGGGKGADEEGNEQEEDEEDKEGDNKLKPGELIVKHESGSFVKFYEDGNVQIYSSKDLNVRAQNDCNVTVHEGDLNVLVEQGDAELITKIGDIKAQADVGDIQALAKVGDIKSIANVGDIYALALVGDIKSTALVGDIKATATIGDIQSYAPLGDIKAITEVGNILAVSDAGSVIVETLSGSVQISAGATVDVLSAVAVNIEAPNVIAGMSGEAVQQLCNITFMNLFNSHVHPTGTGYTGSPTQVAVPTIHSTTSLLGG